MKNSAVSHDEVSHDIPDWSIHLDPGQNGSVHLKGRFGLLANHAKSNQERGLYLK